MAKWIIQRISSRILWNIAVLHFRGKIMVWIVWHLTNPSFCVRLHRTEKDKRKTGDKNHDWIKHWKGWHKCQYFNYVCSLNNSHHLTTFSLVSTSSTMWIFSPVDKVFISTSLAIRTFHMAVCVSSSNLSTAVSSHEPPSTERKTVSLTDKEEDSKPYIQRGKRQALQTKRKTTSVHMHIYKLNFIE